MKIKKPRHAFAMIGDKERARDLILKFANKNAVSQHDIFDINFSQSIKIDDIRKLQHKISLKPHSSNYKIAILENCENMTVEASNALLKTIEEPPSKSIIFLIVKDERELLPTVLSRCFKVNIGAGEVEIDEADIKLFDSIKNFNVKEKFDLANDLSKKDIEEIFEKWLIIIRQKKFKNKQYIDLAKLIYQYRKILKYNINQRLLIENILLEIE